MLEATINQGISDWQLALCLMNHLQKPCADDTGANLRENYIYLAKTLLETLKDSEAKDELAKCIKYYEHQRLGKA